MLKRGDVVLIVSGELGRARPGVVVQADELPADTTSVLVCPMSSDVQGHAHLRPAIEPTPANGLRVRSQIMTDKLLALPRGRVRRVVGAIEPAVSDQLDRALLMVLGLAR